MNNLKQIAIALLELCTRTTSLPPAYIADANGKPMHSWRVLILPLLKNKRCIKKYNFNEPWNGPNNSKLARPDAGSLSLPKPARCDARRFARDELFRSGRTGNCVSRSALGARLRMWRTVQRTRLWSSRPADSNANWMDPRDVTFDEAVELLTTKPRSGHMSVSDGFFTTTYYETSARNVAFCDGHVAIHRPTERSENRQSLADMRRRRIVAATDNRNQEFVRQQFVEPVTTTVIKWGRIWGLAVFVILSLLPALWIRRHNAQMTAR